MAATQLQQVLQKFRRAHFLRDGGGMTDGQLLKCFVSEQNDAAFEVLVRRHGPMVLRVCRRVLRHAHDAEDAFQATFLVLARKAGSIKQRELVGNWLYGVAYRAALEAKAARRRVRECQVSDMPEPEATGDADAWRELRPLLDRELDRLPDKYRVPIVLCDLEGRTRKEVAQQLGIPEGTLSGRLTTARRMLAKRLARHRPGFSDTALATLLVQAAAPVAMPSILVRGTVKVVAGIAAGQTLAGLTTPKVAALTQGVLKTMLLAKLKPAALLLLLVKVLVWSAVPAAVGGLLLGAYWQNESASMKEAANEIRPQSKAKVPVIQPIQKPVVGKDLFGDPLPGGAIARLGTVRWRHDALVFLVALSPDGKTVISAADDRLVRIWDMATGRELRRFGPGRKDLPIRPGAENEFEDGEKFGWDLVAVSRDCTLLATRFEPDIVLWEIGSGKNLGSITVDRHGASELAFGPDGKILAIANSFGQIRIWDIDAGKFVTEFGKSTGTLGTRRPYFAPDGTLITVLSQEDTPNRTQNNSFQFWDPTTGRELRTIKTSSLSNGDHHYPKAICSLVISPDSTLLAYATRDSEVCVLRVADGELLRKWKVAEPMGYTVLAFATDSAKLYSKSSDDDGVQFQEWDVRTGERLRHLPLQEEVSGPHTRYYMHHGCLAISTDGKTMATGSGNNSLHFFDLESGKDLQSATGHAHRLTSLTYLHDGKSLLTSAFDCTLQVWDTATGKMVKRLALPDKVVEVTTVDGRYLAFEDGKQRICVLDTVSGKEIIAMSAPEYGIGRAFFFSPEGRTFLVYEFNGTQALLYDVGVAKERCRIALPERSNSRLFFSPDGQRLFVYSHTPTTSVRVQAVYDAFSGKVLQQIELDEFDWFDGGAFSPDGRSLAWARNDGQVQFFELASGKIRRSYGQKYTSRPDTLYGSFKTMRWARWWRGEPGSSSLAFSPNGRLVAHAREEKELRIWDVTGGQALARFSGHTAALTGVAFAPDGRSVATASKDTTALIWDVSRFGQRPKPVDLTPTELEQCWKDLSGDAVTAFDTIGKLVSSPKYAVTYLDQKLKPATVVAEKLIMQHIADLSSDQFKTRDIATKELERLGGIAQPNLQKALAGKITLEMKRRVEALLDKLENAKLPPETLRQIRAVEVLEFIGTPESRQLLQSLADGAAGSRLTKEALASLARLKK